MTQHVNDGLLKTRVEIARQKYDSARSVENFSDYVSSLYKLIDFNLNDHEVIVICAALQIVIEKLLINNCLINGLESSFDIAVTFTQGFAKSLNVVSTLLDNKETDAKLN